MAETIKIIETSRIMATQIPYIEGGGFDLKKFAENFINAANRLEQQQECIDELAEELKGKVEALMRFHNKKFGFQEKIEQQQKELEKHRWIPLSERLPEYEVKVILCCIRSKSVDIGRRTDESETYNSDMWATETKIFYPAAFTHWMPIILPEQAIAKAEEFLG